MLLQMYFLSLFKNHSEKYIRKLREIEFEKKTNK